MRTPVAALVLALAPTLLAVQCEVSNVDGTAGDGGAQEEAVETAGDVDPVDAQLTFLWHQGTVEADTSRHAEANPFRGRTTPSSETRLHDFDSDAPDLADRDDAFDALGAAPVAADPFPEELGPFAARPRNRNDFVIFPFTEIRDSTTGRVLQDALGGDYGANVSCLPQELETCAPPPVAQPPIGPDGFVPTSESDVICPGSIFRGPAANATPLEEQLFGYTGRVGCMPAASRGNGSLPWEENDPFGTFFDPIFNPPGGDRNLRIVGGSHELPLRPGPDRSNRSTPLDPAIAQGLFLPADPALAAYARNVDPLTGRPRAAGASGACTGASDPAGSWTAANADPKDPAAMNVAGIGRDPSCLKPGAAALGANESSGLNENGFGPGIRRFELPIDDPSTPGDESTTPCIPTSLNCSGDVVPDPATGEPQQVFYVMNSLGALVTDQSAPFFTYAPFECDPGDPAGSGADPVTGLPYTPFDPAAGEQCLPARALNAVRTRFFVPGTLDVTPGGIAGASPQNALEHHPANQQLFATLCADLQPPIDDYDPTGAGALDPRTCLPAIFNSTGLLNDVLAPIPFSELLSIVLAGEPDGLGGASNVLDVVAGILRPINAPPVHPWIVVPLNRDADDGVITAMNRGINRITPGLPDPLGIAYFNPHPEDFLTLDSTGTNEGRMLWGCGPFAGTRCDSAARSDASQGLIPAFFGGLGALEGGGVDLQLGEAGAVLGAVPGGPGTDPAAPEYAGTPFAPGSPLFDGSALPSQQAIGFGTGDVDVYDCLDATGNPIVDPGTGEEVCVNSDPGPGDPTQIPALRGFDYTRSVELASSWTTTGSLPQPGTIGFLGFSPLCLRDAGGAEPVILPGCRGARAFLNAGDEDGNDIPDAFDAGNFDVEFDAGYDPGRDGCVFAPELRPIHPVTLSRTSLPVRGFEPDGSPVDLSACADSTTRRGSFVQSSPEGDAVVVDEAGTLYHPLAGCRVDAVDSVAGLPCNGAPLLEYSTDTVLDPEGRDFDTELLAGTAQVFRNEMAAASYNLLQLLIATSCDEDESDVETDPSCFDDEVPFAVARCSWTTPQLCRNVQTFLGFTDDDRDDDGIPDGDDNCIDVPNPDQTNTNAGADDDPFLPGVQEYGNACDPDLDDDGVIQGMDRLMQLACFRGETFPGADCADADLVGDEPVSPPDGDVDDFDRERLDEWFTQAGSRPGFAP